MLLQYGLQPGETAIEPFGSGLINDTWKVSSRGREFILQRINDRIFTVPDTIAHNVRTIAAYLQTHYPHYDFVVPEKTGEHKDLVRLDPGGYFRLMPFVKGSQTYDVATSVTQAWEAARQFGRFTRYLSALDPGQLQTTLPDFHNLRLRYRQFEEALRTGNNTRIAETGDSIRFLQQHLFILEEFEELTRGVLKCRVTHHDTKISNVLFNSEGRGTHVIDLDTVMPGYFISDIGDMIRTYVSPANEEEKDLGRIRIRSDFFQALKSGYLSEMGTALSVEEKDLFVFAGKYMIYMQAIRFLTDYLQNDVYYDTRYEGQNKVRAQNQIALLKALYEKEEELTRL